MSVSNVSVSEIPDFLPAENDMTNFLHIYIVFLFFLYSLSYFYFLWNKLNFLYVVHELWYKKSQDKCLVRIRLENLINPSISIIISFFPIYISLEHHERYYLYLIISVTIGVLLCLIIITGRIIIQKQREENEDSSKDEPKFQKSNTGETTITKGYSGDSITDIEGGDIDLTTPIAITNLPLKNEVSFIDCNNNGPNIQNIQNIYKIYKTLNIKPFFTCH